MILQTEPVCKSPIPEETWQQALAGVVRDPKELFKLLELDMEQLPAAIQADKKFALRVPHAFIRRIAKRDWNDPLLRQILPVSEELDFQAGFTADPLDEKSANSRPGLIHKYHGRVLLIVSGGCAINCRYCFRRHFPYTENNPGRQQWPATLEYIARDNSISEVILSGGDPLAASNSLLADLVKQLEAIPHVKTLRVHTRMPIMIPQRIDQECLQWLTGSRLNSVMVVHCNHPNELDEDTGMALSKLKSAGVTLLNQSVLLAGVNDDSQVLRSLSERLFEFGVLPYYLHLLDEVEGAAHFNIDKDTAAALVRELLATLPGYLVPKLVKEYAGAKSKTPMSPF
jgi:EF-P beta-lysylation protein EpmB